MTHRILIFQISQHRKFVIKMTKSKRRSHWNSKIKYHNPFQIRVKWLMFKNYFKIQFVSKVVWLLSPPYMIWVAQNACLSLNLTQYAINFNINYYDLSYHAHHGKHWDCHYFVYLIIFIDYNTYPYTLTETHHGCGLTSNAFKQTCWTFCLLRGERVSCFLALHASIWIRQRKGLQNIQATRGLMSAWTKCSRRHN